MTTRREFVRKTTVALGAVAAGDAVLGRRDLFAAAGGLPVRSGAARIERIGVQLYTVRSEMAKDVPATLARVAQIGYKEVEFAGYFSLLPDRVRALLDQNGLTSPSVHVAIETLERDFAAFSAGAKTIGHRWLIVPSLNTRALQTVDDWKGIAARFNALGKQARDAGLRFAFHNHAVEPAVTPAGFRPYDILLGETDPGTVDFQMDLFWMIKAGGDPIKYFASNAGRFSSVHVKDGTAPPELAQRDVGSGTIDWKAIFAKRAQAGIRHYYVEHDNPGSDPFMSIKSSHDYLAKLEF